MYRLLICGEKYVQILWRLYIFFSENNVGRLSSGQQNRRHPCELRMCRVRLRHRCTMWMVHAWFLGASHRGPVKREHPHSAAHHRGPHGEFLRPVCRRAGGSHKTQPGRDRWSDGHMNGFSCREDEWSCKLFDFLELPSCVWTT